MKHLIRSGRTSKLIRVGATATHKAYSYRRKPGFTRVPGAIGPLKKGMLTSYGYHPVEAMTNRHKALSKAITKGKEAPLSVFRRLQAISTLTKRTLPRASRIYKQDAVWVRGKYAKSFGQKKMSS